MCDEAGLDACFDGELSDPSLAICERSWAALEQCGVTVTLDEATFYTDCALEYAADPAATIAKVKSVSRIILTPLTSSVSTRSRSAERSEALLSESHKSALRSDILGDRRVSEFTHTLA